MIVIIFLMGLITMRSASFANMREAPVRTKQVKIVVANYRIASDWVSGCLLKRA
jgi:hypothetical protein